MKNELKIEYIPVEKIRPNPYQPRKNFDQSSLEDLAKSIMEHGIMQPITLRMIGNSYELIAGERRLKAAKIAGLKTIPAVIAEVTSKDSAILALIENLQRENLNFIEESEAYSIVMQDYGYTQQEFAATLGKNQSTVANKLRILKLPHEIKKLLIEHNLTERHARALLKLPSPELQYKAIKKIIKHDLNVKKSEQLINDMLYEISNDEAPNKESNQKVKTYIKDIRLFTNTITQAVNIIQQSGIDAKYTMQEKPDGYEIKIKIPIT